MDYNSCSETNNALGFPYGFANSTPARYGLHNSLMFNLIATLLKATPKIAVDPVLAPLGIMGDSVPMERLIRTLKENLRCIDDYVKQCFIGHSPEGNHCSAHGIKDRIVQWLDPKPTPYERPTPRPLEFEGYLQDY